MTSPLPIDYLCRRLRYEVTTGRLYWLHYGPLGDRYNNRWAGREAFTSVGSNGYRHGSVDGVHMLAHRLIWAMWHGEWPEDEIDHEDHVKTHNWISNLRERDHAGNARNMARSRANTSGVTGVVWNAGKGRWQATIRKTFLGYFDSLDDAAAARKAADVALDFDPFHGAPR